MNIEKINFYKEPDFGLMFSDIFRFYTEEFRKIMKPIFYFSAPLYLVALIVSTIFAVDIEDVSTLTKPDFFRTSGFKLVIIYLLFFLANIMLTTVVLTYFKMYLVGKTRNYDIKEHWNIIEEYFIKVFLTQFAYLVILILLLIITFVLPIMLNNQIFIFFSFIGLIFIVLYAVSLSLVSVSAVFENKSVISALKRSTEIVKDRWWFLFGLFTFVVLIASFIGMFFAIPEMISDALSHEVNNKLITFFLSGFQTLGTLLTAPITVIMSATVFLAFREEKEKTSLAKKVSEIKINEKEAEENNNEDYKF